MKFYNKYGKRLFDLAAAFCGIIVLSPLFIIISIVVKVTSKGPILFKQERMGTNFKPFNIYKFRSMVAGAENKGPGVTCVTDSRITPIGRFLRKTKLDELPQLFNVLFGHMSLVGPRPEIEKFVEKAKSEYHHILSVKPGITDFAAIEYRDEEKIMSQFSDKEKAYIEKVMPTKIGLYKKYIESQNFSTDCKIILKTFKRILS